MGADDILAFYFDCSSFIFETRGCVKNVIFIKGLYEIFKKWCLFTLPDISVPDKIS